MPGKVAPHLNKEVELVLAGKKPLAAIEKSKDPNGYNFAIELSKAGKLVSRIVGDEEVVFTKSSYYLIDKYENLLRNGVRYLGIKNYHREMGRMFGYTEADIEAFISAEIDCDCFKCTGSAPEPTLLYVERSVQNPLNKFM
jgi:hypothetical protein